MPLINHEQFVQNLNPNEADRNAQIRQQTQEEPKHPLSSVVEAAFARENLLFSPYKLGAKDTAITDVNYDPAKRLIEQGDHSYLPHINQFLTADNDEEVEAVKARIDKEEEYSRIIQESGWTGIATSMAAGILDPTVLIPGGAGFKAATAGKAALRGLGTGALFGTVAVGAQEAGLQTLQATRTGEESVIATVAGGILGGMLGAGAAAFANTGVRKAQESIIAHVLQDQDIKINLKERGEVGSVGAAEVNLNTLKSDEGLAHLNETVVRTLSGRADHDLISSTISSPVVEGLTNTFSTMRKFTNDLFDHNFIIGKNIRGEASDISVESSIKLAERNIRQVNNTVKSAYFKHLGINPDDVTSNIQAGVKRLNKEGLSYTQFNQELAKAMRRGDVHRIPEIERAAKEIRKELDAVTDRLKAVGVFDEALDVKYARSYLTRAYDQKKLLTGTGKERFIAKLTSHFERKGLVREDALEQAGKSYDNIIGLGDDSLALTNAYVNKSPKGKITKQRVLDIPDEDIEEFLISDATQLSTNYLRQANHIAALHEYLQKNGYETINDLTASLKSEYDRLVAKNPNDLDKLSKEFKKAQQLLKDQIEIATGTFGTKGKVDQGLRLLRKFNVMRLLGAVTISSIPDLMMPVFRHGLRRTVEDGYLPMLRGLKESKLARDQLKELGVGVELETGAWLRAMTDPDFSVTQHRSSIEKVADTASDIFSRASLMAYWNNFGKRMAGHMSQARTLKSLDTFAKTGKLPQKEIERLASLRIDQSMYTRIHEQFQRYGYKEKGSYVSNFQNWTDAEAAKVFKSSVLSETDSTILTPGRGDVSRFAQGSELGKTIFQFKSFSSAATNKILLSGLQRRDREALSGLIGLVGLGVASYAIKEKLAGRTPSEDPGVLLKEGITRSGVAGLLGDNIIGSAFGSSRYRSQGLRGTLFGPSVDVLPEALGGLINIAQKGISSDEDLKASDFKRLIKFIPFSNLFYIKSLINKALEK